MFSPSVSTTIQNFSRRVCHVHPYIRCTVSHWLATVGLFHRLSAPEKGRGTQQGPIGYHQRSTDWSKPSRPKLFGGLQSMKLWDRCNPNSYIHSPIHSSFHNEFSTSLQSICCPASASALLPLGAIFLLQITRIIALDLSHSVAVQPQEEFQKKCASVQPSDTAVPAMHIPDLTSPMFSRLPGKYSNLHRISSGLILHTAKSYMQTAAVGNIQINFSLGIRASFIYPFCIQS